MDFALHSFWLFFHFNSSPSLCLKAQKNNLRAHQKRHEAGVDMTDERDEEEREDREEGDGEVIGW